MQSEFPFVKEIKNPKPKELEEMTYEELVEMYNRKPTKTLKIELWARRHMHMSIITADGIKKIS